MNIPKILAPFLWLPLLLYLMLICLFPQDGDKVAK